MSNQTSSQGNQSKKPTHFISQMSGKGRNTEFETLGVAWEREDGKGLYVKLYGKQIIEGGFYIYPSKDSNETGDTGQ